MLLPEEHTFAVLADETRFADFLHRLQDRSEDGKALSHVFLVTDLVTDSEDAFREMAGQVKAPHVIQLYRDYLENFVINQGEGSPPVNLNGAALGGPAGCGPRHQGSGVRWRGSTSIFRTRMMAFGSPMTQSGTSTMQFRTRMTEFRECSGCNGEFLELNDEL